MLRITKCADLGEVTALAQTKWSSSSWEDETGCYLMDWNEDLAWQLDTLQKVEEWMLIAARLNPLRESSPGASFDLMATLDYRYKALAETLFTPNQLERIYGPSNQQTRSKGFA